LGVTLSGAAEGFEREKLKGLDLGWVSEFFGVSDVADPKLNRLLWGAVLVLNRVLTGGVDATLLAGDGNKLVAGTAGDTFDPKGLKMAPVGAAEVGTLSFVAGIFGVVDPREAKMFEAAGVEVLACADVVFCGVDPKAKKLLGAAEAEVFACVVGLF